MAEYVLEAETRMIVGKHVRHLRAQGLVPIAVYGPKIEPLKLQVPYRPLQVILMKAGGTNLIDLKVKGAKPLTVLAREVQRDVLRNDILHVDFFAVDESSTIRTEVPIHLVGESPAIAARQGILLTGASTLTIETLPSKLLHRIDVDLSSLAEIGDAIHVRDLDLGEGIIIHSDPDEMLVRVTQTSAARAEEEEEDAAEEVTPGEPEVIAKGKVEEEEEF